MVVLLAVEYGMAASKFRRTHTQDAAAAAAGKADAGAAAPPAAATAAAKPVGDGRVLEEKENVQAAEPPAWGYLSTEETKQGPAAAEVELPSAVREEGA